MENGKDLRHACVGGQGFDPCLLHNIFLNICFQIPITQRAYYRPHHHHPQINQHQIRRSRWLETMVDIPTCSTLNHTLAMGLQLLSLGQNFSLQPQFGLTPPRAYFSISQFFILLFSFYFFCFKSFFIIKISKITKK